VIPIFSGNSYCTDSRFGTAQENIRTASEICGKEPLHTIAQVEPIGPKKLLDALIVAPCTGNTLAKMAHGITDGVVTMAVKAQLRNRRPVVIAIATNDGLGANLFNIAMVLEKKNVYFVPFGQDDAYGKPTSLICDFKRIPDTLNAALRGRQLQPVLLE
jgi:dipicolinate synthase subunit B